MQCRQKDKKAASASEDGKDSTDIYKNVQNYNVCFLQPAKSQNETQLL